MKTPQLLRRQIRSFKRWQRKKQFPVLLAIVLLLSGFFAYAGHMGEQRLRANPESYKPLLNLIAKVESSGNYNAHFGNPSNNRINFTAMSIADVMKWQKDYVAQGSPSSAVGRYQFLSSTLEGLTNEMRLKPTQKFDESTQNAMAIKLLERRGAEAYINKELTSEQFAANLAKEWAALPKVIGKDPEQSYYADDGLNASLVKSKEVLRAIEPIEAQ